MIVDFHCHSTASDGTCSPTELAAKAAAGGFRVLALTDHDNCDGVKELLAAEKGKAEGPRLVAGIELSIEPGEGFDKFHLLGLGIDPDNAALQAFLRRVLEGRNARNERILANFRRLGIEMDPDGSGSAGTPRPTNSNTQTPKHPNNISPTPNTQTSKHPNNIFSYAHGEVLARPHFARWLMDHGCVKSIAEAFDRYLLPESPAATRCYEERYHPSQEEAFRVIHGAGGLCVMAHPKYWRRYWKDTGPEYADAARELARLKEAGLDGVEALYQANTGEENVEFVRLAMQLGFLKTAGSDFHGSNKPTIPLGMTVDDDYIAPFLEALNLV